MGEWLHSEQVPLPNLRLGLRPGWSGGLKKPQLWCSAWEVRVGPKHRPRAQIRWEARDICPGKDPQRRPRVLGPKSVTATRMANSSLPCLTHHTRPNQSVGAQGRVLHTVRAMGSACMCVVCLNVQACVHVCVIMCMQVSPGLCQCECVQKLVV